MTLQLTKPEATTLYQIILWSLDNPMYTKATIRAIEALFVKLFPEG